jgi:putative aldouronate transport system substrate-binding protein
VRNWKKLLALLLTLCMVCGMLAACGSGSTDTTTDTAATTETETTAESAAQEEPAEAPSTDTEEAPAEEAAPAEDSAAPVAATGLAAEVFGADASPAEWSLPLSDGSEPLTLWATFPDALFASYPNGMLDCDIYQEAERVTGVSIEYNPLSTSASSEQFNVMVASGDYPDMIGWGLNYASGDESAIEEEVYLDLTEIIADYAPNYYNLLASDDELLQSALTDAGYISSFFALVTEDGLASFGPMIRTDLLDKLGLEKPYTIDEYHEVLTAFKNEGVAEPLVLLAPGCAQDDWIAGAFGVSAFLNNFPMSSAPFYVEDGVVKFGVVEEGFQEYISLMHDWYEEGLIDPDFISENSNWNGPDYAMKIQNGDCGIFYSDYGNIGGYNAGSEVEGFHVEATYDAHMTEDSVNHFGNFSSKSAGNGIHLTTACSNVELAAQWCDWWYTDEASLLANYGIEGRGYELVDGVPTYTELVTDADGMSIRDALLVYASNNTVCCVIDSHALDTAYSQEDIDAPEIWATGMDNANRMPSGVSLNMTEQETYSARYTDIETVCMESIAKFITGAKPLSEFDELIENCYAMGLQECLDAYQSAYDRYVG